MGSCVSTDRDKINHIKPEIYKEKPYSINNNHQNNELKNIMYSPMQTNMISTTQVVQPPKVRVRALFNYTARHTDDLEFKKDDIMYIISDLREAWWLAIHATSQLQGYIPSNYVAIDDGSPRSVEGWHNITHKVADKKLLRPGNPVGTYIIRPSSDSKSYAISIRHFDLVKQYHVVKHYKIRVLDSDKGYYISNRKKFPDISALIKYYQSNSDGLCCKLSIACPQSHIPPIQFKDIEVNRQCIRMEKPLGNGSFGEVFLAKWNDSVEVAVKIVKPNSMDRSRFIAEAELMHKLNHERIVQLLGVCTQPVDQPVYIITELMVKGALLSYLRSTDGHRLGLNYMLEMMGQIAEGMAYLELKCFVHRDLRAANILVDEDLSVKVADFGLARVTDDIYNADTGTKFPIKWTAPEAGLQRRFSVKSDVWSFGVLMFEIVTYGASPYSDTANRDVLDRVSKGYRLEHPAKKGFHCPDQLYNVMMQCWDAYPENRPTFSHLKDIFNHWEVNAESQYFS